MRHYVKQLSILSLGLTVATTAAVGDVIKLSISLPTEASSVWSVNVRNFLEGYHFAKKRDELKAANQTLKLDATQKAQLEAFDRLLSQVKRAKDPDALLQSQNFESWVESAQAKLKEHNYEVIFDPSMTLWDQTIATMELLNGFSKAKVEKKGSETKTVYALEIPKLEKTKRFHIYLSEKDRERRIQWLEEASSKLKGADREPELWQVYRPNYVLDDENNLVVPNVKIVPGKMIFIDATGKEDEFLFKAENIMAVAQPGQYAIQKMGDLNVYIPEYVLFSSTLKDPKPGVQAKIIDSMGRYVGGEISKKGYQEAQAIYTRSDEISEMVKISQPPKKVSSAEQIIHDVMNLSAPACTTL